MVGADGKHFDIEIAPFALNLTPQLILNAVRTLTKDPAENRGRQEEE